MVDWLLDDVSTSRALIGAAAIDSLDGAPGALPGSRGAPAPAAPPYEADAEADDDDDVVDGYAARGPESRRPRSMLSVFIDAVVVHDNHKLFGSADLRLDALVVHGGGRPGAPASFCAAATMRFDGITDGKPLQIGENGLRIYTGTPRYFLDLFVLLSRKHDDRDLADVLLAELERAPNDGTRDALVGLGVGTPTAAAITAGFEAAIAVGGLARRALAALTERTIGMYRVSYLEHGNDFGVGRHPADGLRRIDDLSFAYSVRRDARPA